MMSFCPSCGASITPDSNFCPYCGAVVTPPAGQPAGRFHVLRGGSVALVVGVTLLVGSLLWWKGQTPDPTEPAGQGALAQSGAPVTLPSATPSLALPAAAPGQPLRAPATLTPPPTGTPRPLATPPPPAPTGRPRIYGFKACPEPCSDTASNAARTFPGGVTEIFIQWNYENLPPNAHYVRTWTIDGQEWIRYDCVWTNSPSSGTKKIRWWADDGLASGLWEVTIRVNEQVLLREQIRLTGDHQLVPLQEPVRSVCAEDAN